MDTKIVGWVVVVFGLLVAAGGAYGYAATDSMPSLVAGVASGGLLAVSGWMIRARRAGGRRLAVTLCLALAGFFVHRYAKTEKTMPAFPVIVLSVSTALLVWRSRRAAE